MEDGVGVDGGGFIDGPWPVGLSWVSVVLVTISTLRNVYRHLSCYSRPDLQQHVLRIIMVGPLYALSAALCLSVDDGCFFIRTVRDIWEAVVIYSFLTLIIEYMGGEHLCLHSISQREEAVPHLFPLNFCLKPIPTGQMIRIPKIGALQFVAVKPCVAVISILVYACGKFGDPLYQWSLFFVYNISYSVALYALYLIYWASHDHPSLQAKRPLLKFVSVKMIVFLTFWQALLLPHVPLPGTPSRWEDFVLAMEMTCFAFLMNHAFTWQEFHSGLRGSRSHGAGPRTVKIDVPSVDLIGLDGSATASQPGATGQAAVATTVGHANVHSNVVQNAKAAFCPRDIMMDASTNFSRRYQQHVLIESAQEYELGTHETHEAEEGSGKTSSGGSAGTDQASGGALRTFRARTYLIGKSLGFGTDRAPTAPQAGAGADGAPVEVVVDCSGEEAPGDGASSSGVDIDEEHGLPHDLVFDLADAAARSGGVAWAPRGEAAPAAEPAAPAAAAPAAAAATAREEAQEPRGAGGAEAAAAPPASGLQADMRTLHGGFLEQDFSAGAGGQAPGGDEWPRFGGPAPSGNPFD